MLLKQCTAADTGNIPPSRRPRQHASVPLAVADQGGLKLFTRRWPSSTQSLGRAPEHSAPASSSLYAPEEADDNAALRCIRLPDGDVGDIVESLAYLETPVLDRRILHVDGGQSAGH